MQKVPTKENFELTAMKSKDRASIEFQAKLSISDGESTHVATLNDSYPIIPHPDLIEQLDKLKIRLAEYFGYTTFQKVVNNKDFAASKPQKKFAENFQEEQLSNIKVNGVAFSGKTRNGIIVKGTYNGSSINTKTLYFTNQEYGEGLQKIADRLEDEMYKYLFQGKKAQLEVAFD
jgi:hypothetical protein